MAPPARAPRQLTHAAPPVPTPLCAPPCAHPPVQAADGSVSPFFGADEKCKAYATANNKLIGGAALGDGNAFSTR